MLCNYGKGIAANSRCKCRCGSRREDSPGCNHIKTWWAAALPLALALRQSMPSPVNWQCWLFALTLVAVRSAAVLTKFGRALELSAARAAPLHQRIWRRNGRCTRAGKCPLHARMSRIGTPLTVEGAFAVHAGWVQGRSGSARSAAARAPQQICLLTLLRSGYCLWLREYYQFTPVVRT